MLRVIFLGMEIRILDALRRCPVDIVGVYLPPAPYRVRKIAKFFPLLVRAKRFKTAAIYGRLFDFLQMHAIAEMSSPNVNDAGFIARVKKLNTDMGIVANFGQILSPSLLRIPRFGFVNYHPSLLPHYRGPHPFEKILANAEQVSGITWHQMTEKVDQGDILLQPSFPVDPSDSIQDLDSKAIQMAQKTLGPLLAEIENGLVSPRSQCTATAVCHQEPQKRRRCS